MQIIILIMQKMISNAEIMFGTDEAPKRLWCYLRLSLGWKKKPIKEKDKIFLWNIIKHSKRPQKTQKTFNADRRILSMFKKNIEPNQEYYQEYYRETRHHCPVKPVKTTGSLKNRKAKIKPKLTCTRKFGKESRSWMQLWNGHVYTCFKATEDKTEVRETTNKQQVNNLFRNS